MQTVLAKRTHTKHITSAQNQQCLFIVAEPTTTTIKRFYFSLVITKKKRIYKFKTKKNYCPKKPFFFVFLWIFHFPYNFLLHTRALLSVIIPNTLFELSHPIFVYLLLCRIEKKAERQKIRRRLLGHPIFISKFVADAKACANFHLSRVKISVQALYGIL